MLDTSPTESKEPLSNPQDQKLPIDRHAGFHHFFGGLQTHQRLHFLIPPAVLGLLAALCAYPVEVERVVRDGEIELGAHRILNLLDTRIAELEEPPALGADQVVVLPALVGLLKVRHILPELVLHHQPAIQQELYGIVERGSAHPVVLVLHEDVERLDVEMPIAGVDLIEYRESFGRFPMPTHREVAGELLAHVFAYILTSTRAFFHISLLSRFRIRPQR